MTEPSNLLNSFNFARNSDFVFSEVVTKSQFYDLNLKNYTILDETANFLFYKLNYLEIKENDIIFSHISIVENLFNLLSNGDGLQNIKLITSQSDKTINLKLFNKKPKCINNWYSINVEHKNNKLNPIPLGIANNHSPKNLLVKDFKFNNKLNELSDVSMYINFQKNTNLKERMDIFDCFINEDWVEIDQPNLELNLYKEKLKQHMFVLCPWGNGVDTHRIWETLYSGSIPITKYHHTFSRLTGLPILFVDKYEEINLNKLNSFLHLNQNYSFDKLDISYWLSEIKKDVIVNKGILNKTENRFQTFLFYFKFKIKNIVNSKLKKKNVYLSKIKKFLNLLTK